MAVFGKISKTTFITTAGIETIEENSEHFDGFTLSRKIISLGNTVFLYIFDVHTDP